MKFAFPLVLLISGHVVGAVGLGRATFSVLALDSENGMPVEGIMVEGYFLDYSRGWGIAAKEHDVDAWTNKRGYARLSGATEAGEGGFRIPRTPRYYASEWVEVKFRERSVLRLGAWEPGNIVLTTRLDRVMNPIPLYVKDCAGVFRDVVLGDYELIIGVESPSGYSKTNGVAKVENVRMSYDFLKHDWLPPFGKGEISDIQFVFNEDTLGWDKRRGYDGVVLVKKNRFSMMATLPGVGNGIQEIINIKGKGLKIRNATESGYQSSVERWCGYFGVVNGYMDDFDVNRCYTFRIRTEYDDQGNIKSAYYGKIYGDFDIRDVKSVRFCYYLNPTPNDRNLEWDMKKNLWCSKPGYLGNPQP